MARHRTVLATQFSSTIYCFVEILLGFSMGGVFYVIARTCCFTCSARNVFEAFGSFCNGGIVVQVLICDSTYRPKGVFSLRLIEAIMPPIFLFSVV